MFSPIDTTKIITDEIFQSTEVFWDYLKKKEHGKMDAQFYAVYNLKSEI